MNEFDSGYETQPQIAWPAGAMELQQGCRSGLDPDSMICGSESRFKKKKKRKIYR
jgi:hypothetical protein